MFEVGVEPPEVVECVVEATGEAQASLFLIGKSSLQLAEKPTGPRHRKGHGAEFAEQFMPSADEEALLGARNFGKDHRKAFKTGRWEG